MSFSEASGIITQTGTDTNLSGLSGVLGVVVVDNGSHKTYHIDNKQLRINGTLTIDPQVECLLFERYPLYISGTLNFGVTSVIGGATRYSRAIGLISHDDGYARFLVQSGGTLNWNGGAMKLNGGCDFKSGSNVSITNGIIIATNSIGQRLRMNSANCSVDGLSIDGNLRFDVFETFVSFNGYESSFTGFGAFQKVGGSHGGTDDAYVLTDFDAQGIDSANGSFIGSSFSGTKIEFVNMGYGGDFVIAHDGSTTAVTTLYKDVKLKIVDTNISNIAGVKYWATDKDNGDRFAGTAVWRGAENADETFSSDRVYTGSTDSSGEATTRLLTRTCYGGVSPAGAYDGNTTIDYRGETTDNTDVFNFYVASYKHTLNNVSPSCIGTGVLEQQVVLFADVFLTESDKATVDNYSVIENSAMLYDRAKSYLVDNYAGEEDTLITRSGLTIDAGDKNIVLDPNATNVFTFNSALNTITIKCTSFTGNLTTTGTITVNSGVTVLGTLTDATNPAGLSSRSFSISNIILGATVQIYNETQVTKRGTTENYSPTNVYETLIASGTTITSTLVGDGTSTIAQLIAAQGLTADSMADTLYVLPSGWTLATTEVANDNNRVTISGIYDEGAVPNGDFNVGDSVRIRATCAASAGAFLPFVNTTIANESGFSIRVNQQADTIYNNNGIDGSATNYDSNTLTLTPDYNNFQIDVTDSDANGVVTVQQIYAKYAYLITTTEGIDKFFGAITAENTSNYRINADVIDLKIQNISANDTILTGARLYRSDNQTVIAKGYLNNNVAQGPAGTLSHDTGEFLQYIQPQVEAALNGYGVAGTADTDAIKTDTEAVKKNTNLIPGLL